MGPAPRVDRRAAALGRRIALVLAALALLLAALSLGALGVTRQAVREIERNRDESMRNTGEKLAATISARDLLWVLDLVVDAESGSPRAEQFEFYRSTPAWEQLGAVLRGLEGDGVISSAWLLAPSGELLLVGRGDGPTAEEAAEERLRDAAFVARAAAGETVSTRPKDDPERKAVFTPLYGVAEEGRAARVVGVLRLESERRYLDAAQRQVGRALVAFGLGAVLVATLWVWLVRLLRRAQEAERNAAQADRMRTLGTLTAGIAHELRNPLGILRLQIEDLRATAASGALRPEDVRAVADDLEAEAKRLEALTNQFLAYAKPPEQGDSAPCDLAAGARDTLRLYRKGVDPERLRLVEAIPAEPVPVRLGESALRQVLLNLLRNAEEALEGRASGCIEVTVSKRPGGGGLLEVADDGPGLDAAVAEQAFDPFFTTKAKGTGLGLALCRKLAEESGGAIRHTPAPGGGARFAVELPAP
ncbi:MAG: HAMP domain-containing sensor histidine kinase [Candidatus Sumerlaeia bacterium]|nr:HAMP domain-containing sensor histidine kinase [Candidatus Sumerlaeia bacterium]